FSYGFLAVGWPCGSAGRDARRFVWSDMLISIQPRLCQLDGGSIRQCREINAGGLRGRAGVIDDDAARAARFTNGVEGSKTSSYGRYRSDVEVSDAAAGDNSSLTMVRHREKEKVRPRRM